MMKLYKKNEGHVEKLYKLIEECESHELEKRNKSMKILREANEVYSHIRRERGINYLPKNFPDITERFEKIRYRLMEYNS